MVLLDRAARTHRRTDGACAGRRETPTFGGHRVVVDVLESGPERFTVAARESPRPGPGPPFRGPIDDHELVWWVRDDRDNHYLAARYNDELRFSAALGESGSSDLPQSTTTTPSRVSRRSRVRRSRSQICARTG